VDTPIDFKPSLSIRKTVTSWTDTNHNGLHDAGDVIAYNVEVKNTGDVTLVGNNAVLTSYEIDSASGAILFSTYNKLRTQRPAAEGWVAVGAQNSKVITESADIGQGAALGWRLGKSDGCWIFCWLIRLLWWRFLRRWLIVIGWRVRTGRR